MPGDQWELAVATAARHRGWLEDDLSEAGSPVDGLDDVRLYGFSAGRHLSTKHIVVTTGTWRVGPRCRR